MSRDVHITMLVFGKFIFSDITTYNSTFPQKKTIHKNNNVKKIHPYEKPSH